MADADLGTDCASTFGANGLGMDRYFRTITGALAVAHAVARRLTTSRGSMFWAVNDGDDVREYLNESMDRATLLAWSSAIRAEAMGDERVSDAKVSIAFTQETGAAVVTVNGETADGPFVLVLNVTSVTVEVLSIA